MYIENHTATYLTSSTVPIIHKSVPARGTELHFGHSLDTILWALERT
jgi:hypothetical protein